MLLPRFNYSSPKTIEEALSLLSHYGNKAKVLAGGTDLLVNMKKKLLSPEQIVSLNRIEGLKDISFQKGKGFFIGPLCTVSHLSQSKIIQEKISPLAQGAGRLGSPLVRNRATIGGNLVTARPASDLAPPLLVLGAKLVLKGAEKEYTIPLENFFRGPGKTNLPENEILYQIYIPEYEYPTAGSYIKLGTRKALEISLVNVASFLEIDPKGVIKSARVALGAVAPIPLSSSSAAKVLIGVKPKNPEDPVFKEAGRLAAQDSKPITDHRGTADYRRAMVELLTFRTLQAAYTGVLKKIQE